MKLPIYLDYSATAPVDPRVAEKMSNCLLADGDFGKDAKSLEHAQIFRHRPLADGSKQTSVSNSGSARPCHK